MLEAVALSLIGKMIGMLTVENEYVFFSFFKREKKEEKK